MKYLLTFLIAVSGVAFFLQLRAWEKRRVFFAEEVAHVNQMIADRKRAAKLSSMLPEENTMLSQEIERLRDRAYEYHRLIIEELRIKPLGIPLNGNEEQTLSGARAAMKAIDKEKEDERLQRLQGAAEAEAKRRAALERGAPSSTPAPPKPGDWMWRRPSKSMDKPY